ncbi:MAG: hypothetical protein QOF73_2621 [Thermomicrobiales bacterium]|nr:hypothetical protein [Thermomicrobiales bacterium]
MRDRVAVPGEPDRVTARHAQCRRLELRTAGRTLLPGFPVVPRPQRAADRPLQSPCPLSQRRQTVFAMQGIAGNAAVQRLIGRAPATTAVRTNLRRCSCEGTAGTDGECEACRASRLAPPRATNSEIAVQREARPSQAAPSFVSTPAALATALPETVLAAHAEAVNSPPPCRSLRRRWSSAATSTEAPCVRSRRPRERLSAQPPSGMPSMPAPRAR